MKRINSLLAGVALLGMSFTVDGNEMNIDKFSASDFTFSANNISLEAKWLNKGGEMELDLTARNSSDQALEISLVQPRLFRNDALNRTLSPQSVSQIKWMPKIINERNIYTLYVQIKQDEHTLVNLPIQVKGALANAQTLGAPLKSSEIEKSRFGTCTHFAFMGENDMPKIEYLLDQIANAGIKWIREEALVAKDENGNYKLREHDRKWISMAHERGIKVIPFIIMNADEPMEEFLKRVEAQVAGIKEFTNVYELGNEPANFNGWIPTYGGTWNGKKSQEDNSNAPWLEMHVKYTNAAAELIKKLHPEAVVIGLCNVMPANFRALEYGLSPAVDGVVDHAYNYAMPAEVMPYGKGFTSRDGIEAGDEKCTYEGMIKSYADKFQATGHMRSLWITEFGYSTFFNNGENHNLLYAPYSEEAQAVYLVRRFIMSSSLPVIAASFQYDFLDDHGSKEFEQEANFGMLRGDFSKKLAYYAVRRMNSLLANIEVDPQAKITVTAEPLHRAIARGKLLEWDNVEINADNSVKAFAFTNLNPNERVVTIHSALPYSTEFNNRVCTIEIENYADFDAMPVAVNVINGETYDVPFEVKDGKIILSGLSLKNDPLVIKLFKK